MAFFANGGPPSSSSSSSSAGGPMSTRGRTFATKFTYAPSEPRLKRDPLSSTGIGYHAGGFFDRETLTKRAFGLGAGGEAGKKNGGQQTTEQDKSRGGVEQLVHQTQRETIKVGGGASTTSIESLQADYERLAKKMDALKKQHEQRLVLQSFAENPRKPINGVFAHYRKKRMKWTSSGDPTAVVQEQLGAGAKEKKNGGDRPLEQAEDLLDPARTSSTPPPGDSNRGKNVNKLSASHLTFSPQERRPSWVQAPATSKNAGRKFSVSAGSSKSSIHHHGDLKMSSLQASPIPDESSYRDPVGGASQLRNSRNSNASGALHSSVVGLGTMKEGVEDLHQHTSSGNEDAQDGRQGAVGAEQGKKPGLAAKNFHLGLEQRILLTATRELHSQRNANIREAAEEISAALRTKRFARLHLEESTADYLENVVNRWPVWYTKVQELRDDLMHHGERLSTLKWNAEHCNEVLAVQQGLQVFRQQVEQEIAAADVHELDDFALDFDVVAHGHGKEAPGKDGTTGAADEDEAEKIKGGEETPVVPALNLSSVLDHVSPAALKPQRRAELEDEDVKMKSPHADALLPHGDEGKTLKARTMNVPPPTSSRQFQVHQGANRFDPLQAADYMTAFTQPLDAPGFSKTQELRKAKEDAKAMRTGLQTMREKLRYLENPNVDYHCRKDEKGKDHLRVEDDQNQNAATSAQSKSATQQEEQHLSDRDAAQINGGRKRKPEGEAADPQLLDGLSTSPAQAPSLARTKSAAAARPSGQEAGDTCVAMNPVYAEVGDMPRMDVPQISPRSAGQVARRLGSPRGPRQGKAEFLPAGSVRSQHVAPDEDNLDKTGLTSDSDEEDIVATNALKADQTSKTKTQGVAQHYISPSIVEASQESASVLVGGRGSGAVSHESLKMLPEEQRAVEESCGAQPVSNLQAANAATRKQYTQAGPSSRLGRLQETPEHAKPRIGTLSQLNSVRTDDSEQSQDLLSIAQDYQRSRNASEVPQLSARPSPRGQLNSSNGLVPDQRGVMSLIDASSAQLAMTAGSQQSKMGGTSGVAPSAGRGEQVFSSSAEQNYAHMNNESSNKGSSEDSQAKIPPQSILIGERVVPPSPRMSRTLQQSGESSRANISSIPNEESVHLWQQGSRQTLATSTERAARDADTVNAERVLVSGDEGVRSKDPQEHEQEDDHVGDDVFRSHQKSVFLAEGEEDDSSDEEDPLKDAMMFPISGNGALYSASAHAINQLSTGGRTSKSSVASSEDRIASSSANGSKDAGGAMNLGTRGPPCDVADPLLGQALGAGSPTSEVTIRRDHMQTARDSTVTLTDIAADSSGLQGAQGGAASSSTSQSHATTIYATPKTLNSSNSIASKYGGSATVKKVVHTERRTRAGDYSVSNNLRRQISADLSVKLFCFAFLAELVEDQLQDLDDLRGYLSDSIFTQNMTSARESLDLDFIFRFLMDIQDQNEDVIEEFFEADNLAVEHIHAALFLLPMDENPQFVKVLREHCNFLEARRGRQILEKHCEWYAQKRQQGGLRQPGSASRRPQQPLRLNPAFLGSSNVAVDESEFAEISEL
ncbi:unnamed protein product [Amoebophrya sp. A25]|nr:unnamed protein product [Amoebophrya sp. A25]|eukprot:GSA25T00018942001.1